jgi:hypothetical protein
MSEPEDDQLRRETRTCCEDGSCVEQAANIPCFVHSPAPQINSPQTPRTNRFVAIEDKMSLREFAGDKYLYRHSMRGRIATAMQHRGYIGLYLVDIEAEYADLIDDPDTNGDYLQIMTRCIVRVRETFRGDAQVGDVLEVLYDGGALTRDQQYWPSHSARCMPLDRQILAIVQPGGIAKADSALTHSLGFDVPVDEHPSLLLARQVAAELAVTP